MVLMMMMMKGEKKQALILLSEAHCPYILAGIRRSPSAPSHSIAPAVTLRAPCHKMMEGLLLQEPHLILQDGKDAKRAHIYLFLPLMKQKQTSFNSHNSLRKCSLLLLTVGDGGVPPPFPSPLAVSVCCCLPRKHICEVGISVANKQHS